jgi:hypothetical protein
MTTLRYEDFLAVQSMLTEYADSTKRYATQIQKSEPYLEKMVAAIAEAQPYIQELIAERDVQRSVGQKLSAAQVPLTVPLADDDDDDKLTITRAPRQLPKARRQRMPVSILQATLEEAEQGLESKRDLIDRVSKRGYDRGQATSRVSESLKFGLVRIHNEIPKLTSLGQDKLSKYRQRSP